MEQSHTLPGWWFVVLRMKFLNAAEIEGAEMSVLATHLTQIRPAAGGEAPQPSYDTSVADDQSYADYDSGMDMGGDDSF